MSASKLNSNSSKSSSCRFTTSRPISVKITKPRTANPRRVLPSKRVPQNSSSNRKAFSTGLLNDNKKTTTPIKTTKSDFSVRIDPKRPEAPVSLCKNCGDVVATGIDLKRVVSDEKSVRKISTKSKNSSSNSNGNSRNSNGNSRYSNGNSERKTPESVKQYYRNENYRLSESTEEICNGFKKISLDTIKEVSELHPSDSIYKIYPEDSEEYITFLDVDDKDSLRSLKDFRQKNYFECHSAKSRIRSKVLQGHTCVYRFYLNDRLFPVPLNRDHNNQVRCVECNLPMELNVDEVTKINGTIQAKVSIGKKNEDIMLLLPVKEPLIITEKRREDKPIDREVVFFGVINLDGFGNSMFNSTLPGNSLALKYQKGYQEFENKEVYNYRDLDKADVIVI